MDERFDGDTVDGDVDDVVQLDAPVLQDAGHRAAQDAEQRYGFGPLAPRTAAAEHGDGVGEPADQRGAVVDAQQVVEDLGVAPVVLLHLAEFVVLLVDDGLDAPGDVDEGALCRVAHRLLGVDDLEQLLQQVLLGLGDLVEVRVVAAQGANDLRGESPSCSRSIAYGRTSRVKRTIS